MKNFFNELFQYNHDINNRLIEFISKADYEIPSFSLKLFSHILDAHHVWNARIKNLSPVFGIWQEQNVGDFLSIENENYQKSLEIVEDIDLDTLINYYNSKGKAYKNSVRDVLFHVINHSNYHRGQIALDFRQNNIDPLVTDYIFYKRAQ